MNPRHDLVDCNPFDFWAALPESNPITPIAAGKIVSAQRNIEALLNCISEAWTAILAEAAEDWSQEEIEAALCSVRREKIK